MAFEQRSLDDYIDVAQRIADFREKYPEGRLCPLNPAEPYKIVQAQGFEKNGDLINQTFIIVVAAAYRTPLEEVPGVGMAWEIFPGRTPYTRGSELQNAETSAWGRAIIAVGASDSKRGIASREEMRNRQAERDEPAYERCGALSVPGLFATQIACGLPKDHYLYSGAAGLHGWEPGALPRNADGSLSRSRTSDAEKAGAGVMTSAQQAEHTALAKPPPNSGRADRIKVSERPQWDGRPGDIAAYGGAGGTSNAPAMTQPGSGGVVDAAVDDRWTGDAPSWLVGVDPPEDQPGSILPAQRSQIMAVYTSLGIKDRGKRIEDVNAVLASGERGPVLAGPVESVNELSHKQAARLLENLHDRHTGKMTRR